MDYKEMILEYMDSPDDKTMKVLEMTDSLIKRYMECHEKEAKEFLVMVSGTLNGKHFSKHTAKFAIDNMEATLLVRNGERYHGTVCSYMEELGITPQKCKEMITQSYRTAMDFARRYGWSAPELKSSINEYDMYVAFAMVLADFWVEVCGDLDKASMITYQWLSDPDAECTKTWDYLME